MSGNLRKILFIFALSFPFVLLGAGAIMLSAPDAYAAKKAPVNLNTASEQELEELKGVGPATAKKIIEGRPYKSVDDLSKAGLTKSQIKSLKRDVTVKAEKPSSSEKKEKKTKAEKAEAATASAKPATGQLVDINSASEKELEDLKGVGSATAKKIIAGRPYKSVDELSKAGVSKSTIKSIKPHVTVGAAAVPAPAPKETTKAMAQEKAEKTPKAAPAMAAKAHNATPATGARVNINTASQKELESLPGIGPVKSRAIIEGRPYKNPEDIMKVKGIKEGTYSKIKDLISVE